MIIYHGSTVVVNHPIIRTERFNKDFYFGFYCTIFENQAIRWATRFGNGFLNRYEYTPNEHLKKSFTRFLFMGTSKGLKALPFSGILYALVITPASCKPDNNSLVLPLAHILEVK